MQGLQRQFVDFGKGISIETKGGDLNVIVRAGSSVEFKKM